MGRLRLSLFFGLALNAFLACNVRADEGMWTFDAFPVEKLQAYHFTPTAEWLENVRLASVRLARGCSGSIVSTQGLVMTNHHCASSCVQQLSSATDDRIAKGFYAAKLEDEVRCPDVEVNQLVEISDVTDRIRGAVKDKDGTVYSEAYRAETASIAHECAEGNDKIRCDVVDLYHGGQYRLYKYRRYSDVRLVFAPELQIAFFGGDPDNFQFPRYDLDVSYMRIYEDGKPLASPHYFPYAAADATEGDLTFVSGNPGSTERQATIAELTYSRDVQLPQNLFYLSELRGTLTAFSAIGPEQARIADRDLFGVENSLKALKGRFEALVDPALIRDKRRIETVLKERVANDPVLAQRVGPAWDNIDKALRHLKVIRDRYNWLEARRGFGSSAVADARSLLRYAAEKSKPQGERLDEYTDANFPILRQSLLSSAAIYPELEKLELTFGLTKMREALGADDAAVKKILGSKSPRALATELIDGTSLLTTQARQKLLEGGQAAIDASNDPIIQFVRSFDVEARAVRKDYENNVKAVLDKNSGLIAEATFKIYGTKIYPDATFTPRLSYGQMKGYDSVGKHVSAFTTIAGLFARSTDSDPFKLPETWLMAKNTLNPNQKMNFVTTNDIIGGNSGSPVINSRAEVVGLVFDGNIESLGGEYGFDPKVNRAVAVSVGALREALWKVYHADRLSAELTPEH